MKETQALIESIVQNIEKVIVGKRQVAELSVVNLLSQGHLLIEDVPGVGKTMLARSLACSIGSSFGRIQFTPDMLPSDVTGVSVYNQAAQKFEFRAGPIMAEIVLADEINRATPKTQAALLEAMQERQVTVDGITHPLPALFMVLATQNPIEYEGTFRLPEAQLDRFLMRIKLGYPDFDDEINVLKNQLLQHPIETLSPVVSAEEVLQAQNDIRRVHVEQSVYRYIVELVRKTRQHDDTYLGASPRGSLGLLRASQARAVMLGRDFVIPDDVKALATVVLGHRIILAPGAHLRDMDESTVMTELLEKVLVPGGKYAPQ
ncbi:MAG TPA: AAA family ATPase [Chloroflexi bacterium]|nr:AAA family ATPase [Chloroflexota bacterium]